MTYKEAFGIQTISYAHNTPHENFEEAREKLFEACWKADKYRWHDLRKDPTDLPEVGKPFVYAFYTKGSTADIPLYNSAMGFEYEVKCMENQGNGYAEYIAWMYFEPFESEV